MTDACNAKHAVHNLINNHIIVIYPIGIRPFEKKGHGLLSLAKVLVLSCLSRFLFNCDAYLKMESQTVTHKSHVG